MAETATDVNAEQPLERQITDSTVLATLNASEIDQQVRTARAYPRSLKLFLNEAREMATLTEEVSQECIYALPRDGKMIEGPSIRFAEVVLCAWGNARAGARVVGEEREFVTAQGAFHDLQRNVAITYEVKRRIVDKKGRRFRLDMIVVTANAACSIALRNAILRGVPKPFWNEIYKSARQTVRGDSKTLATRRADALKYLAGFGADEKKVLAALGVRGIEDIGLDHLVYLRGLATAIKDGDTTVEQAFARPDSDTSGEASIPGRGVSGLKENLKGKVIGRRDAERALAEQNAGPPLTADEIAAAIRSAQTIDEIDQAGDLVGSVEDKGARAALTAAYLEARKVLTAVA